MAKPIANGFEIARYHALYLIDPDDKEVEVPALLPRIQGQWYRRYQYSFRSNGAILEKYRDLRPDGTGTKWGPWRHYLARKERTLKQQMVESIANDYRFNFKEVWNGIWRPTEQA